MVASGDWAEKQRVAGSSSGAGKSILVVEEGAGTLSEHCCGAIEQSSMLTRGPRGHLGVDPAFAHMCALYVPPQAKKRC